MSGGVEATRAGEQETGGSQQTAESCYRGGEETEWSAGETSGAGPAAQVTLTLTVSAAWSHKKNIQFSS